MSDAPSFLPDHDFVELLWENGPIVMQGQLNRQKKSSYPTPIPSHNFRVQEKDGRDPTNQKFGQFRAIDSTLNELSQAVPCANIGLNTQDDDMAPWMNYPIEDPLCSEFFSELAGISPNPRPTVRNSAVAEDFHNVENGNASKALREGSEPSKIKSNNIFQSSAVNNTRPKHVDSSTHQGQSQKQNLVSNPKPLHSSSGFGLMNFSHFSRPAYLARANNESLDRLKAKEKVSPATASTNQMQSTLIQCSETLHKAEMRSVEKNKGDVEAICHEDASRNIYRSNSVVANNHCTPSDHKINNQISSFVASMAVGRNENEKGPEPIVASSSVCSGNSAGAASNDPKHRDKRKNREGEESGYHSEDLDDESTGLKKPTAPRGGTGTKRSRAAEVHNLSERRRRDRINEKMRALQELIPNCNKVDKASMLDEAIEYLKTLQLQVQMMSMGSRLCMPPMMLPPGMQHLHTPPMAHFPAMNVGMGMGMGMGMGYGMGMLDMNGIPIPSMHTSQFPCPPIPGSTGLQLFGIPGHMHGHGQGLPMPLPRAPLFNPLSYLTPKGNPMNEVLGTIANPLPASDVGPSSRCMNLEAKQNVSNRESQAQLAHMGNQAPHGNNGNATANTISDAGKGLSR